MSEISGTRDVCLVIDVRMGCRHAHHAVSSLVALDVCFAMPGLRRVDPSQAVQRIGAERRSQPDHPPHRSSARG